MEFSHESQAEDCIIS